MVSLPPVPQIITITSEALQAKIRQILPSQQGFGADLAAQNVIVPVVDLTASAEGSSVPENLQTALAFGSQTAFDCTNATVVLANSPGFYRVFGFATIKERDSGTQSFNFALSDGSTDKNIAGMEVTPTTNNFAVWTYDFVVFLAAGESLKAVSNSTETVAQGSTRQIADINGTLVQPSGFTPQ
jgi:hypothetical protein